MRRTSLARLAPTVATQLDAVQEAIRNLGEAIGVALAAQAEQQTIEQTKPQPEPAPTTHIIEAASSTIGYRVQEVAERLTVAPATVWRWVREGRFPPPIRIGKMVSIWPEDVIAKWFLERQMKPAPTAIPREKLLTERRRRNKTKGQRQRHVAAGAFECVTEEVPEAGKA